MSGKLQERVWQFKLTDEKADDCAGYFEKRAGELAAALNCRLVATTNVRVEPLPTNARMVSGTAFLENPRENVVMFGKSKRRRLS
jgi:hypothetical protein